MSVKVLMHPFIAGDKIASGPFLVEGRTVGDCIKAFLERNPELEDKLFIKPGQLHAYIEVYVNEESAYPEELSRPVKEGDEISITYLMSGG